MDTGLLPFVCECGNECSLEQTHPISPDPYADPICGECFEKARQEAAEARIAELEAEARKLKAELMNAIYDAVCTGPFHERTVTWTRWEELSRELGEWERSQGLHDAA